MQKLQLQNQLAAYLSSEEIEMILSMAKKVDGDSEEKVKAFKEKLRKERLQMIDDKWTEEVRAEKVATKDLLQEVSYMFETIWNFIQDEWV